MNEAERWINGEGPEPACITALLASSREAAREARQVEMSPALEAELDGLVARAVAEQQRGWARTRRIKIGLAVGAGTAVAAAAAGIVALVLRAGVPADASFLREAAASALTLTPGDSSATPGPLAPAPVTPGTASPRSAPRR